MPFITGFQHWTTRITVGTIYTVFYMVYAPHWLFTCSCRSTTPCPIHGALVNTAATSSATATRHAHGDQSKNTSSSIRHRRRALSEQPSRAPDESNFASRWFEIDPTYSVIRVLAWLRIIELERSPARSVRLQRRRLARACSA